MNQTPNYSLNQWERSDRVLMEDFNADNAKIDAAVAALQTAVSAKAEASALTALAQTVAHKGNCQIVTGQYTGTGTKGPNNPTVFTFDKKPMVLLIASQYAIMISIQGAARTAYIGASVSETAITTWTGNSVSIYSEYSEHYQANTAGFVHRYVALVEA